MPNFGPYPFVFPPQGSFHDEKFLFTFRGDSFRSEFRKISLREHLGVTQSSPPFSRERRNRVSRLPSCPSLLIINSGFEFQKGNRDREKQYASCLKQMRPLVENEYGIANNKKCRALDYIFFCYKNTSVSKTFESVFIGLSNDSILVCHSH